MKNCEINVNGDILTITVDLSKDFGKSSSGKSIIIASTEGNVPIPEKEGMKSALTFTKEYKERCVFLVQSICGSENYFYRES